MTKKLRRRSSSAKPPVFRGDPDLLRQIELIEQEVRKRHTQLHIRKANVTHGQLMPPGLGKRVRRFIDLDLIEQKAKKMDDPDNDLPVEPSKSLQLSQRRSENFNESTITEILEREKTFVPIKLKIDPPPEKRKPMTKEANWVAQMMRSKRTDRVKWPSKLYYFDRKFSQKSLYEQADDLMDMVSKCLFII